MRDELEPFGQQSPRGEHHVIGAASWNDWWRVALHLRHDVEPVVADPWRTADQLEVLKLVGEGNQHPHWCVVRAEAPAGLAPDIRSGGGRVAALDGRRLEVERDVRIRRGDQACRGRNDCARSIADASRDTTRLNAEAAAIIFFRIVTPMEGSDLGLTPHLDDPGGA